MYVRKSVVAGSFYPGDPGKLRSMINGFLNNTVKERSEISGKITGIISPHAGYVYSGQVAAYGFSYLSSIDIDTFIVLAPSHRARFKGASVIPEGFYSTPLGDAVIDGSIGKKLADSDGFSFIPEAHEMEHSLEVQVPFIQVINESAQIVPVVIGTTDLSLCMALGKSIASAVADSEKNFSVIISTDLSHYHSYSSAAEMDQSLIKSIESFNESEISRVLKSGKAEACGEGPLIAGMSLCRAMGAKSVKSVKYANSGDTAGSKDQVVGYMAAVFTG